MNEILHIITNLCSENCSVSCFSVSNILFVYSHQLTFCWHLNICATNPSLRCYIKISLSSKHSWLQCCSQTIFQMNELSPDQTLTGYKRSTELFQTYISLGTNTDRGSNSNSLECPFPRRDSTTSYYQS
jgi:hypothetical protein